MANDSEGVFKGGIRIRYLLIALSVLIGLGAKAFDSFGTATSADVGAARRLATVIGPFYDRIASPHRDDIIVVLFDDAALAARTQEDSRPELRISSPSYGDQQAIIAAARDAGAASVFFDITYSRALESEDSAMFLAGSAKAASAAGTPIFFGPINDSATLAKQAQGLNQVDVRWSGDRPDAYPMSGVHRRSTAAMALYQSLCARKTSSARCDALNANDPEMIITWGRGAPKDLFTTWDKESLRGCSTDRSFLGALGESFRAWAREAFRAVVSSQARALQSRCSYHASVRGDLVIDAVNRPDGAETLKKLFANRVVLVGAAQSAGSDYEFAPGYGQIPGVFQHAMALDNFLTYGRDYKRAPPDLLFKLSWADFLETFLAILGAVALTWALRVDDDGKFVLPFGRAAGGIAIVVATFLAATGITYFWLHWPPANVQGIAVTTAGAFALAHKPLWDRITSGRLSFAASASVLLLLSVCVLAAITMLG